jgi:alpha-L-rhamnosidase
MHGRSGMLIDGVLAALACTVASDAALRNGCVMPPRAGIRGKASTRPGLPSNPLNHCSQGAAISFLQRHVARIQLLDDEPAYRRFGVVPVRGGWLSLAGASHDRQFARIEAPWRREREWFALAVTVPPGQEDDVVLPVGRTEHHGPGKRAYAAPWSQIAGPE